MKEKYTVPALEIIREPTANTFLTNSSDLNDDNWGYSDVFKP